MPEADPPTRPRLRLVSEASRIDTSRQTTSVRSIEYPPDSMVGTLGIFTATFASMAFTSANSSAGFAHAESCKKSSSRRSVARREVFFVILSISGDFIRSKPSSLLSRKSLYFSLWRVWSLDRGVAHSRESVFSLKNILPSFLDSIIDDFILSSRRRM